MAKRIYIINGDPNYDKLWQWAGWSVVSDIHDADAVQFTGGADVDPILYGQHSHLSTRTNPDRDRKEIIKYRQAKKLGLPCFGICRGSQFIHVMNGGFLYQDVSDHLGNHDVIDKATGEVYLCSSTHHQMMGDPNVGKVVAYTNRQAIRKVTCFPEKEDHHRHGVIHANDSIDIEGMYYPATNDFGFQPHPEFFVHRKEFTRCAEMYMNYIHELIIEKKEAA